MGLAVCISLKNMEIFSFGYKRYISFSEERGSKFEYFADFIVHFPPLSQL